MKTLLNMVVAGRAALGAILALGLASQGLAYPAPVPGGGFAVTGPAPQEMVSKDYRIGPLDKLDITVFQVKDLTLDGVQVDGSGRISLPLIGNVTAAGKTAPELGDEIATLLKGKYLQNPQVTVTVSDAISQKVTIDGAVREPGVYAMSGPTTLLQAVAMAKGPDPKIAKLDRVAVFRTTNGQRTAAVFDLKAIRAGKADDPEIYGNDVIVVDGSMLKSVLREALGALPGLAIFRTF